PGLGRGELAALAALFLLIVAGLFSKFLPHTLGLGPRRTIAFGFPLLCIAGAGFLIHSRYPVLDDFITGPMSDGWDKMMLTLHLASHEGGATQGTNLFTAGIILALMSVPVIVSLGEDALRAVPDSYREAALALGANPWETVRRVLFPAAR